MWNNWYLCKVLWKYRETFDESNPVEFQTTLRGQPLRWYMKLVDPQPPGATPLTLDWVKRFFILEFQLPQSERQGLTKLGDLKKIEGESAQEYMP